MPKPDSRIIAAENELRVLELAWRMGWARASDFAYAVWPHGSQAAAMARRTVSRLLRRDELIGALSQHGPVYGLGRPGARRLIAAGVHDANGQPPTSSKDALRGARERNAPHRMLCNEIALYLQRRHPDTQIVFERELLARRWPLHKDLTKTPDALQLFPPHHACWIEVERAYKNRQDFDRLVQHLLRLGDNPLDGEPLPVGGGYHMFSALVAGRPFDIKRILDALHRVNDERVRNILELDPGVDSPLCFAVRLAPFDFITLTAPEADAALATLAALRIETNAETLAGAALSAALVGLGAAHPSAEQVAAETEGIEQFLAEEYATAEEPDMEWVDVDVEGAELDAWKVPVALTASGGLGRAPAG